MFDLWVFGQSVKKFLQHLELGAINIDQDQDRPSELLRCFVD